MIYDRFRKNELLSKHTNFRIGGPAKYFFEEKTSDKIVEAVRWAQGKHEQFFILGGGSNVLVSDNGFDGLVIKNANRDIEIHGTEVTAGAGALSALVARKTAEAGLTGFEWAISLPGTIGGAVRGNAGCFGGEMKDVIGTVTVFDVQKNVKCQMSNVKCQFAYRDSIFKHMDRAPVILSVELSLKGDDPATCRKRVEEKLKNRKEKQPLESSSAGCIFKNYQLPTTNYQLDLKIPKEFFNSKLVPAGWLIEQAGLKGLRVGGAEISQKHGNFIVNKSHAAATDILEIIKRVKKVAKNKFKIELQEEIQYVGFS